MTVSSGLCHGSVNDGIASIQFNDAPEVELVKPDVECGIDEEVELELIFTGSGPFDYSYEISGENFDATTDGTATINIAVNETFRLISFSDQSCPGEVVDSLHTFKNFSIPEAEIITENATICGDGEAEILISFSGAAPFEFEITNGTVSETITTSQFEFSYFTDQEGDFEIVSIKSGLCEGTASGTASVVNKAIPTVELNTPEINCDATESAMITLTFSGEAPFNYSYDLSGETVSASSNDEAVELEIALNHSFQLLSFSDSFCDGEVEDGEFTFNNYAPVTAEIQSSETYICEMGEEAIILISFTGALPISFEISNGTESEVLTATEHEFEYVATSPGTYEVTAVSNDVCDGSSSGSASVILYDEKPTLEFNATSSQFCEGDATNINFEFTGTATWTFVLKNGETETELASEESTLTIEATTAGLYEIVNFSDAYCSVDVSKTIELSYLDKPTAVISGGGSFCGEDEAVTVDIALQGQPPFNVVYTNGTENTEITVDGFEYSFETSIAGTYTLVSVSDENCTGDVSGEAIVTDLGDELAGEITGPGNSCKGEAVILSFEGSEAFSTINWTTTGAGQINDNGTNEIEYIPAEDESGEIDFEVTVVNDCGERTFSYTLLIILTPIADFTVSPDELFTETDVVFIAEESREGNYSWDFGDGDTDSGDQVIHIYDEAGNYEVTLTVEIEGCENSASVGIAVKSKNELYVPNVFNPNALNSENRVVKVYGTNISEEGFSFRIVNRWGNTMYQTSSFNQANSVGWDGREFNIDEMQALSAFSYVLKGKFNDGEPFERTGTITILQ